jgi:hypothetical protein
MFLLYLVGAALGAAFGLLALLVPQKTVQFCVEDDLRLRMLGNFVLRMLGAALLVGAVAGFEHAGGLPTMPDASALMRGQLSRFNNAAAQIIAPPQTQGTPSGEAYRTQRRRRDDDEGY